MLSYRYIFICLVLIMQGNMSSIKADNEIYIILDMDLESINIGGKIKHIGDEFNDNDTIYWPQISNLSMSVVKKSILLKRPPKKDDIKIIPKTASKAERKAAVIYINMASRGVEEDKNKEANNIFRLKKRNKLLIPVKHPPMQNMKPEVVWGDNFVNTIRRSADDKNYELTDDIFFDLKKNSIITITIRETSVTDASVVENVYQDLILVYVP